MRIQSTIRIIMMTMMTVGCETRKKFKKISKKVLTNYRIGAIINNVLG